MRIRMHSPENLDICWLCVRKNVVHAQVGLIKQQTVQLSTETAHTVCHSAQSALKLSHKKNISQTRCRRSGLDPPTNPAHATDYSLIFYFSYLGISTKNNRLTRGMLSIGRMPGGNQWWMKLRSIMGILAQHDSTYEVLHQDNTICFASLRQIFLQLFAKIISYR